MTVSDAMAWCNQQVGKALDFDGVYGAQCTDFFNFYYQHITGRNPYSDGAGVAGAKDLWGVAFPNFTKVQNNPSDPNQLPPQGSMLIYDGGLSGSGGYGHVAIVDSANAQQVTVYDQNWGGMYVHHQAHMWTGHEIGWLVFGGFQTNITLDQLTQLYEDLLHRAPDQGGIDHYVGHYTYDFVKNDILHSAEYAALNAPKETPSVPQTTQPVAQAPAQTSEPATPAAPAPQTNVTQTTTATNPTVSQTSSTTETAPPKVTVVTSTPTQVTHSVTVCTPELTAHSLKELIAAVLRKLVGRL